MALFGQGILDAFGRKHLDDVGPGDVRGYAAELVGRGEQPRAHLSLVNAVLKAAVEFGVLEKLTELPKGSRSACSRALAGKRVPARKAN